MAYLTEKNIETIAYSIVQQYMNVYNISSNEVFKVSPENVANMLGIIVTCTVKSTVKSLLF